MRHVSVMNKITADGIRAINRTFFALSRSVLVRCTAIRINLVAACRRCGQGIANAAMSRNGVRRGLALKRRARRPFGACAKDTAPPPCGEHFGACPNARETCPAPQAWRAAIMDP
jgi:hypothetical protein